MWFGRKTFGSKRLEGAWGSTGDWACLPGGKTDLSGSKGPWGPAASSFHFLLQTGRETLLSSLGSGIHFFCGGLCSVAFSVPAFKGGLLFGFVLFLTTPDVRSRSYLIFSHLLLLLVIRAVWLPHCGGQSALEGTN